MTPTQRTLKLLRDMGYHAHVVERWVAQARKRIDVAGFGDILAWRVGAWSATGLYVSSTIALIQTTTTDNAAAREKKIQTECADAARAWQSAGGRIVVIGWSKKGERGKRKTWQHSWREVEVEPAPHPAVRP